MPYACYDSDECRGKQVCDMRKFVCVDPTPAPTTPGCCMSDTYKSNDKCMRATVEDKCEDQGCLWITTRDPSDCELTTTTTTEEPGCCSSDDARKFERCNERETRDQCERLDDCFFVSGVDAVCEPQETTVEEGCCMGDSMKSQDKCMRATDRDRCEDMGCEFIVTDDPRRDCVFTTSTEEPGCCKGDSASRNPMCNTRTEKNKCERSSSCHWIIGGELEDDCADPTTTEEPGCCYGNPDTAYSNMWMDSCTAFYTERECLKLTDQDGAYRCHWESKGEEYDCSQLWPTTTTTTLVPGCCRGGSYKAQDKCYGIEDQLGCERKGCEFVFTDDPSDCELTTTEETGCCGSDDNRKFDMCNAKETRELCERANDCYFVFGEDAVCEPQETTIEAGCCASVDDGYSGTVESCAEKETPEKCDRSSKCEWRAGEDADCSMPTTTEEPWAGAKPQQVLYGAGSQGIESVIAEQMQATVSLSTLLMLIALAFVVRQLYCYCWAGKAKLQETGTRKPYANYQTV